MAVQLSSTKSEASPEIHPGDIVRVHQKIKEGGKERIQVFEGIVIKTHGKTGSNATFTVRKIAYGVGVEKTYPLDSPSVVKIEFKKASEVKRAKLYYLRKLSGKSLKMKEKKMDREVWELIAKPTEVEEPSEELLEEAIKAEAEKQKAEVTTEDAEVTPEEVTSEEVVPTETESSEDQPEPAAVKDDTVEAEVDGGNQTTEPES